MRREPELDDAPFAEKTYDQWCGQPGGRTCMAWVTTIIVRPSAGKIGHHGEDLGGHPRVERSTIGSSNRIARSSIAEGPSDGHSLLLASRVAEGIAWILSARPTRSSSTLSPASAHPGRVPRT